MASYITMTNGTIVYLARKACHELIQIKKGSNNALLKVRENML